MHTNKLIHEKSPYLLQHAHNPVNWMPWGEEAFAAARTGNKPIFLSIGYSTCHWCHVMERESFESEETAALLNEHFVPVKVDREERPDVDRIYMAFVQAATGGGGWPLSVWLTPELKPFYGGTYYPPVDAYGRPGFPTVLRRLAEAWEKDREGIVRASERSLEQLQAQVESSAGGEHRLGEEVFATAYQVFRRLYDPRHGGFGGAPKFPRPVTHNFLLRYHHRTRNQEALEMVLATLRVMAAGGMNDQLGGGFHRYSVDERWFVPHFEKMLYDQAQLAASFVEAFQLTGEEFHASAARDIFEYVLRDMTHPEGGFYSAEDADSVIDPARPEEKGEGAFFIWTQEEITAALGSPRAEWFCYRYGVRPEGNVASDPHGEFQGKNILFQEHSIEEAARHFGVDAAEMAVALGECKAALFQIREQRIRPHLDDKILTSWNGMMISALARGARALGEPRYLAAARRAADFLLARMWNAGTGALLRRFRDGEALIHGFLDDYANLILGLLDLYESSFEIAYLETAIALAGKEIELFTDAAAGGFFSTSGGDASLVMRMKDDYDGAEPSGNSMATLGLLRLAHLTGRKEFREAADRALAHFSAGLIDAPHGAPQMLAALDLALGAPKQIVIAADAWDDATERFASEVWRRFEPRRVLLLATPESRARLAAISPALAEMAPVDGKPTAYVCENFTCELPCADEEEFRKLLQ